MFEKDSSRDSESIYSITIINSKNLHDKTKKLTCQNDLLLLRLIVAKKSKIVMNRQLRNVKDQIKMN